MVASVSSPRAGNHVIDTPETVQEEMPSPKAGFFSSLRDVSSKYLNHLSSIEPSSYFGIQNKYTASALDSTTRLFVGASEITLAAGVAVAAYRNDPITNLIKIITTVGGFSVGASAVSLGLMYGFHKLGFNQPAEIINFLFKKVIASNLTAENFSKLIDLSASAIFEKFPEDQKSQFKTDFLNAQSSHDKIRIMSHAICLSNERYKIASERIETIQGEKYTEETVALTQDWSESLGINDPQPNPLLSALVGVLLLYAKNSLARAFFTPAEAVEHAAAALSGNADSESIGLEGLLDEEADLSEFHEAQNLPEQAPASQQSVVGNAVIPPPLPIRPNNGNTLEAPRSAQPPVLPSSQGDASNQENNLVAQNLRENIPVLQQARVANVATPLSSSVRPLPAPPVTARVQALSQAQPSAATSSNGNVSDEDDLSEFHEAQNLPEEIPASQSARGGNVVNPPPLPARTNNGNTVAVLRQAQPPASTSSEEEASDQENDLNAQNLQENIDVGQPAAATGNPIPPRVRPRLYNFFSNMRGREGVRRISLTQIFTSVRNALPRFSFRRTPTSNMRAAAPTSAEQHRVPNANPPRSTMAELRKNFSDGLAHIFSRTTDAPNTETVLAPEQNNAQPDPAPVIQS